MVRKSVSIFIILYLLQIAAKSQNNTFLPKPTGEYYVGTENLFFTDNSRKENLTLKWGDKRQLQVKIWYPSDVKGDSENHYLKEYSAELLWKSYKIFEVGKSFFDSLKSFKTYSYDNIPVSNKQVGGFPVIVFSQGFYFGLDDFYTALMENLASHGYIVVSITRPYDQVIAKTSDGNVLTLSKYRVIKAYLQWKKVEFMHDKNPDTANVRKTNRILKAYLRGMKVFNKSLKIWTKDAQFVMDTLKSINNSAVNDRLYHKIDFSKVGTLGQSFGGAVAGNHCYMDSTVKAGVNLDCFQFGTLYKHEMKKPFMLLQSESYPLWRTGNNIIYAKTSPFYSFILKGTKHFIFSDCCLFPIGSNKKMRELIGTENGTPNVKLINERIIDFYDHYLNNIPFKTKDFQTY